MMFRPFHGVVGALALVATACNSGDNFVQASGATFRLVNDTDIPLSLANAGVVDTLDTKVLFGRASGCVFVNLSNTAVPSPTITNSGPGVPISFTPGLSAGDNLLIVAFIDATGALQFATLGNQFALTPGNAGLRLFNGAASAGPLLMLRNGTALTGFIPLGSGSSFVSVPPDSASIAFSNGPAVVLNAGQMAFPASQSSTVLIGPPAPASTGLRFFTIQGC